MFGGLGGGQVRGLLCGIQAGENLAVLRTGCRVTRQPRMGAAQLPEVAVRRLVESKAVREKSLCDCRLKVYERQFVDSFGSP